MLMIASPAVAEDKKLEEAFNLLNQLNISSSQAETMVQIKTNLRTAHQLSKKAQMDLLSCLEREADAKEEKKPE